MKNANSMNAIRAIAASGPLADGRGEMMQLITAISDSNSGSAIMLLVAAHNGECGDFFAGCGSTLARAYRRLEDTLRRWGEDGWMVTAVYVGVLRPDSIVGATYGTYCLYTYDHGGLPLREIERMAGGKVDDIDGKAFLSATSAIYYSRHLRRGDDAAAEEMERNTAAIARIDKDAHAAQMWFSRHYGRPA